VGRKFLAPPYYSQCAVFAFLSTFFIIIIIIDVLYCWSHIWFICRIIETGCEVRFPHWSSRSVAYLIMELMNCISALLR